MLIFSPQKILSILIGGVENSISLSLTLIAIYAIWLSIINIMEKTGINKALCKLLKPIVKKLFKNESDLTYEYITLNIATNMLGMGSAATPLGIKAIESMNKSNTITNNMILFVVINASSIQLLPTTIVSLRTAYNSIDASSIILPCIISTIFTTIFGIILCKIFKRFWK